MMATQLNFLVPPQNQGQMVTDAYAGTEDGFVICRTSDASDGTVTYQIAEASEDDTGEYWQSLPEVEGDFRDLTPDEARRYDLPMPGYRLEMSDESGGPETVEIVAETDEAAQAEIADALKEYVAAGEWGDEGARVAVQWTLYHGSEEIESGSNDVDVEPDHAALIRQACQAAGVPVRTICGTDPDDHDWTSEGEGGLDENPGVWSTGGTSMVFRSHCRTCGLRRCERHTGSQRNPGEHDTVEYDLPESDE